MQLPIFPFSLYCYGLVKIKILKYLLEKNEKRKYLIQKNIFKSSTVI